MTFEPENQLERALLQATTDALARPTFYHLLMSEPLVVAGEIVLAANDGSDGMNLAVMRHNGRAYHPIFTSFSRLKTLSTTESRHFAMVGRDLFARTRGADFVLNPGSEVGKQLTPTEIAYWLDPSAQARRTLASNPPQARLSASKEPPRVLIEALRIFFRNRRQIVAAYVLEVAFSDRDEPPHPLIVIEAEGGVEKIGGEISELSAATMPELIIDLMRHDRAEPDPSLAPFLGNLQPFYQRESTE